MGAHLASYQPIHSASQQPIHPASYQPIHLPTYLSENKFSISSDQTNIFYVLFSWENRLEYAKAVLEFRLGELSCEPRMRAIRTGLATVVPVHILTILNPSDLEIRTCGIPNVDLDFLRVSIFCSGVQSIYFLL